MEERTGDLTVWLTDGSSFTFELTGSSEGAGPHALNEIGKHELVCFDDRNGFLIVRSAEIARVRAVRVPF